MNSYASTIFAVEIDLLLGNGRDLLDPSLSSYYQVSSKALNDLNARFLSSQEFRFENDLPDVFRGAFGQDSSPASGPSFFSKVMSGSGVQAVYVEDVQVATLTEKLPAGIQSFLAKESKRNSALFQPPGTSKESLHLTQDPVASTADDDPVIYSRLKEAQTYIRRIAR